MILELSVVAPLQHVKANARLPWSRQGLSQNKEMSVKEMRDLEEVMAQLVDDWDWMHLSSVVNISDIKSNPDKPWDRRGLSTNATVRISDMKRLDEILTNAVGEWVTG